MNTFGINTFLFSGSFTNDSVGLFNRFSQWGFDSVEIAMDDPTVLDPIRIKAALDQQNLICDSACVAMGPGRDLRGRTEDQEVAKEYIKDCIRVLSEIGGRVLVGPLYSVVGRANAETSQDYRRQWNTVVNHLKLLAGYAGEFGITLAIEPLNRYETDFLNTVGQGLDLISDINYPNVRLHLDSYHMNIEEKFPHEAIVVAGDYLAHFHACGVDRGTPGNDHMDWNKTIHALKQINYQGSIVIESFTPDVKVIAKAASIWRQTEPSQEAIATAGLSFLHSKWLSS